MEELLYRKNADKLNTVYSTILAVTKDDSANTAKSTFRDFAQVVRKFNYWKKTSSTNYSSSSANLVSPSFLPSVQERISDNTGEKKVDETAISASWLLDLCCSTNSNALLPHPHTMGNELPLAVHEICTKYQHDGEEAELQAALFELIGTDYMELLHVLVQNAANIATYIQRDDLQKLLESKTTTSSITGTFQGNNKQQQQRAQKLREEALEALNIAAIAKSEAESITRKGIATSGSITHSVTRASDKVLWKEAKRAAKLAAAAVARANEAGVTIGNERLLSSLDISALRDEADNFQKTKGLAGMTEENLQDMKANLLPEGSKQYYESRGLPSETKREFGDGYEKVIIPPRTIDQSKRKTRIKISDVMNTTERMAFAGTESLNPMQSVVYEAAFLSQEVRIILHA
jgi:hypothetical protein